MSKIKRYYEDLLFDPYYCRDELARDPDNFMARQVLQCYDMAWEALDNSPYPPTDKNCYILASHILYHVFSFEDNDLNKAYEEYKKMDYDDKVYYLRHFIDDLIANDTLHGDDLDV